MRGAVRTRAATRRGEYGVPSSQRFKREITAVAV